MTRSGAFGLGAALVSVLAPVRASATPLDRPVNPDTPYHLFAGFGLGRGIRFNNPYRLRTELGSDAESLSLTAPYADVQLGALLGSARPFSHGVSLHASFALEGVPQEVLTPSYQFLYRPVPRWGVTARAGVPIVVEPDLNAGFELAAGGLFFATAGVAVSASLVGSLFYGAATLDTPRTAIPIVSAELAVIYDFEGFL
ncbi:MAG TPA: hypothetical protein VHE30_26335 [Polyangiaceae bacterium]|nr:hypothetical protein [Polyangiaceae bacterium]